METAEGQGDYKSKPLWMLTLVYSKAGKINGIHFITEQLQALILRRSNRFTHVVSKDVGIRQTLLAANSWVFFFLTSAPLTGKVGIIKESMQPGWEHSAKRLRSTIPTSVSIQNASTTPTAVPSPAALLGLSINVILSNTEVKGMEIPGRKSQRQSCACACASLES